ncbi:MAG: TolC family protein, partial [Calditrichaeota bacterium]
VGESRAQQLPSLAINGIYTHVGKVTSFTIPMGNISRTFRFGTSDRFNAELSLRLPLFTWGRISGGIGMAHTGKELSVLERRREISAILYQTIQAYYSVLLNQRIIELHRSNVRRSEEFLKIAENRYKSGAIPRLEILRTEVQLKNSISQLEDANGNLQKSALLLRKLIQYPDTAIHLEGALRFNPVNAVEENIMDRALEVRSDLNAIELQQVLKEYEIQIAGSSNKPSLMFFSGYNVQNGFDPTNPDRFVDNWNLGLQLSFPLFNGFATTHKIENARLDYQKAVLQKQELQDIILLQIRQALTTLHQSALKIGSQQENIKLADEAVGVATEQFSLGIASSLDVLTAQQTLSQSEMLYSQALFNHIMAKLELSRIMEEYSWFAPELEKSLEK